MSASCHRPTTTTNPTIAETFTLRWATCYGGFNAVSDVVRAVGLDAALAEAFDAEKAPWATYPLPETLRHLLDGYLLGIERVWHVADLEQRPLLCAKRSRAAAGLHGALW